jgi:SAM-dependent methyltransferase
MRGSCRRRPRGQSPVSSTPAPAGINATFWSLLVSDDLHDKTIVDVGTGSGRVALAVASRCRRVVGLERDRGLVAEAERHAKASSIDNVRFVLADADALPDFRDLAPDVHVEPDLVVAHRFLSNRLVENAAKSLTPGGALVALGFHVDQWRETGRASRFAYDEERMRRLLDEHGLVMEFMTVDRDVKTFGSVEEALAAAVGVEDKWRADGRWFRYIEFLERGGRTLTHAYLVVKARRR